MHRLLLHTAIFLFCIFSAQAQNYHLQKNIALPENAKIEIDHFNNIYVYTSSEIKKYDENGNYKYTYNIAESGNISYFDVTDPFKPLVYFEDFGLLKILDNKLSEINEINLLESYVGNLSLILASSAQEFWAFDKNSNSLKNLNYNFEHIQESEALQQIGKLNSNPSKIYLQNDYIYLLDNHGIKKFDLYANYIKTIAIENINSFQIQENKIIFYQNGLLKSYDEKTFEVRKMKLPETKEPIIDVKLTPLNLILQSSKSLSLFKKK